MKWLIGIGVVGFIAYRVMTKKWNPNPTPIAR